MKNRNSNPNIYPQQGVSMPRNAFDMSFHSYFTSPTGLILPTFVQEVNPGDYMQLEVSNFTRTLPVNTAAFARLKEKQDFYFVPFRLIWRWFDQFYTSVTDLDSAYSPVAPNTPPANLPYVLGSSIKSMLDSTTNDMFGFPIANTLERLLDLLGYPVDAGFSANTNAFYAGDYNTKKFNPFRLFAYSRLLFEFYRNSDYENNLPQSYNLDNLGNDGNAATNFVAFVNSLSSMCYKNWSKDRFTNIKPSVNWGQFGSVPSYVPNSSLSGNSIDDGSVFNYAANGGQSINNVAVISNTQGLRNALAVDKLARISQLSPKTYEAQMKAHFGVDVDSCGYCSCRYLGSFDSNINISEVLATAAGVNTGKSSSFVGEVYGRGISSGRTNRPIKAQFNEPGIVMGMHYVVPMAEYDSNRVDPFNKKLTRADYFVPEYDSLGLQTLQQDDVSALTSATSTQANSDILGYVPRYNEYKSRVDEVHCNFQSHGNLRAWSVPRTPTLSKLNVKNLIRVSPLVTQSIFSAVPNGSKDSDSYLCHYLYNCKMVRNMSVYGLPAL